MRRTTLRTSTVAIAVLGMLVGVVSMRPAPASAQGIFDGTEDAAEWLAALTAYVTEEDARHPPTRKPQECRMIPLNGSFFWGDPAAYYTPMGGWRFGRAPFAFKIEGEFPHSETFNLTGYDDLGLIPGGEYTLDDASIIPDKGHKNPFTPGTKIDVKNRKYTAWAWPDTVPVPDDLQNVFLYKVEPTDRLNLLGRFSWVIRRYGIQPGVEPIDEEPRVTLYRTSDLKTPMKRCEFGVISGLVTLGIDLIRSVTVYGSGSPPQPWRDIPGSNALAFSRAPAQFVPVPEGWDEDGSATYTSVIMDVTKLNVVTLHKTPTFFSNVNLDKNAKFGEYQIRFMSFVLGARWPILPTDTVNQDNAIYQPDGAWVTVGLPQDPPLSEEQEMQVRVKAALLGYNVIGGGELERFSPLEPGTLAFRAKIPAPGFEGSVLNIPSWVDPDDPDTAGNDYRDWNTAGVDDPNYYDKFVSSPSNQGAYYMDGVTETFEEFMAR